MSDESTTQYYLAIVASGLSVLGWLSAVLLVVYTVYLLVLGDPAHQPALGVLISVGAGIWFARMEKSLYRVE